MRPFADVRICSEIVFVHPTGVLERAPADASVGLPTNRDNRAQVEVCARR